MVPTTRRTADANPVAGYAGATISELPSLYDGMIKLVRTELDISAFGVQIMDLAPDYTTQSHDESSTGQQELYVALSGSGAVLIGDERPGRLARAVRRRRPGRGLHAAGLDRRGIARTDGTGSARAV